MQHPLMNLVNFIWKICGPVIESDNFWVCSKFTSLHIPISLVYSQSRNSVTQLILVIIPLLVDADDSEAPGGLKADEDNWQLFVFVQDDVIEVPAVAHGGGGGAVAAVPVPAVVAVVGEAKLLGGLEGIGSTCQTNKNIIIIWPNKLYRGHSAVDI